MSQHAADPVQAAEEKAEAKARAQAVVDRVAANARRLREERGWTQEAAAERCGIHTTLYRTVEGGRTNFTASTVAQLALGLGVDVMELFRPAPPIARRKRGRPRKHGAEEPTAVPPPAGGSLVDPVAQVPGEAHGSDVRQSSLSDANHA